jgi:hypothetical protein
MTNCALKLLSEMNASQKIDALEAAICDMPTRIYPEPVHHFAPGIYARELFMPAGSLITSKIHKTEHPYIISKGRALVWTEQDGVVEICAPHFGITLPGTRRVLFIYEDCIWTTFHSTNMTDPDEIENEITERHVPETIAANVVTLLRERL